jgi:hypothetical protein
MVSYTSQYQTTMPCIRQVPRLLGDRRSSGTSLSRWYVKFESARSPQVLPPQLVSIREMVLTKSTTLSGTV